MTKVNGAPPGDGPPLFGLPGSSAVTVEGRIERATGAATRARRLRDGREQPIRSSFWATGLLLIVSALTLVVLLAVALYLIG